MIGYQRAWAVWVESAKGTSNGREYTGTEGAGHPGT